MTSQEYFSKLLTTSTKLDKILEYLLFKRNLPNLLPEVKTALETLVRTELKVEEALCNLDLGDAVTQEDGETPLLDALGLRIGQPVARILAPPTVDCLLCHRQLTKHNTPSTVALFTMTGPLLASKYIWRYCYLQYIDHHNLHIKRCRNCPKANLLKQGQLSFKVFFFFVSFGPIL